jgi:hypothetical protein
MGFARKRDAWQRGQVKARRAELIQAEKLLRAASGSPTKK